MRVNYLELVHMLCRSILAIVVPTSYILTKRLILFCHPVQLLEFDESKTANSSKESKKVE